MTKFYKYHGAGNDFLIADGRGRHLEMSVQEIVSLCDRHLGFGADGLMVLEDSDRVDFAMRYYNSDGSGGMMCGNGGRCIAAFAADLGFTHFDFEAPDGLHHVEMVSGTPWDERTVRIGMKDVSGVVAYPDEGAYFLDTGTRHFVTFVSKVEAADVFNKGREMRYDARFAPVGTNVNFVEAASDGLRVRTYEKGVENETLACGTGIVASAIASFLMGVRPSAVHSDRVEYRVYSRIARLSVAFSVNGTGIQEFEAKDVTLTGPAAFVGTVEPKG